MPGANFSHREAHPSLRRPSATMKYRPDINGLRAVAVLAVVIFHASPHALPGGFIGVDMFFVISGFLISGILWEQLQENAFSFSKFYARRAWRLLPALYATLLGTLATVFALFQPSVVRQTAMSTVSTVAFVSNVRFALQTGYFDVSAYRKPLLHTWSLAVEEQFYFIWPVILVAMYRYRRSLSPNLALPALIALVILSEVAVHTNPSLAYFLVPFRLFQFLTGAALHTIRPLDSYFMQEALAVTGVCSTGLSLSRFSHSTPFPGVAALLPTLATAALIHSPRSNIASVLGTPVLSWIGRISYSVYLVHWPLIVFLSLLSSSPQLKHDEALYLVVASFALGYALYHSVEVRFRSGPPGSDANDAVRAPGRTLHLFVATGAIMCAVAYGAVARSYSKAVAFRETLTAMGAGGRNGATARFNETEAALWESELITRRARNGRARLRQRPGLVEDGNIMTWRPAKPAKARMLLFGDSHAREIQALALRIALEQGFALDSLTKPGCIGLLTAMMGKAYSIQQKRWREALERTPYDLVVVTTRWTPLTEDTKFGEFLLPQRSKILYHKEKRDVVMLRERFTKLLGETVDIVLNSGAQIMLLGAAPDVGKNTRGCLELPISKKAVEEGRVPAACHGATRRDVMRRTWFMDSLFEKMAHANRRVTSATATKYFCNDYESIYCRTVHGGRGLYYDKNHISTAGVMLFSQSLKENSYEGIDFNYRNPKAQHWKEKEP